MPLNAPVRYRPDLEQIKADEQTAIDSINESMRFIVGKTHADQGKALRGVHAKSHALLQAELTVHEGLPPELTQGIFAEPGRIFPALVRISSIAGDMLPDTVSLPRGFSIKIFDVPGERLAGSEDDTTQDFLFATAPAFSAPDAAGFAKSLKLVAQTTDRVEGLKIAMSAVLRPLVRLLQGLGIEIGILKALGGYPENHVLGERYFTQVPIRFGDFVAKLDVVPRSANFRGLTGERVDLGRGPNVLRDTAADVIGREGGEWTLRAQLCRDLSTNPIEDSSVAWPEDGNPYLDIATITVAPQMSWSDSRSRVMDDQMSFRPWRGVEAHRPLGNIMRARRQSYPVSVDTRAALNGCPIHEPKQPPAGL
ncbi:MAG: catalase family protein [Rhizobium sp.]|nr:catalase family protein [Rhizobium sp.]